MPSRQISDGRFVSRKLCAVLSNAIICLLGLTLMSSLQAQTFTVLHTFTGPDGVFPTGSLVMDGAGNLYGTNRGSIVYELLAGRDWVLSPLYRFQAGSDGWDPQGGVVLDPGGLYGTTWNGGGQGCTLGCGTVFRLRPPGTAPKSALTPWNETVIYRFQGTPDGQNPAYGALVFDAAGAAYGTTEFGGNQSGCSRSSCGTVYKLTPSGGSWTESVLYAFAGDPDGAQPIGGVVFDNVGNLYGTTFQGGTYGYGTVFQLTPSAGGWTKTILHEFTGGDDGGQPVASLTRDSSGNLYGTTTLGGAGGGTVFEITPTGGGWTFSPLHAFTGGYGSGPAAPVTTDAGGNLYGTTFGTGTYNGGVVFKLSPSGSGWTYNVLHEFTWGADGAQPSGQILIAPSGSLYGTAYSGGNLSACPRNGCGVVWQITP